MRATHLTASSLWERIVALGIEDRAKAICATHGVTFAEVIGPRRFAPYVAARHEIWLELRSHGWSYPFIASVFGNVDHTSVMHGVKKAECRATKVRVA